MSIDLAGIIKKATQLAEQATAEDKAGNHEIAVEAYTASAEWLIHATKYGPMNVAIKHNLRSKIDTYLKRAEELKKRQTKTPVSANPSGPCETSEDPETARMLQKFQGAIVTHPDVSFDDVVGLQQAKTALKEAVILPVKFPRLFRGRRKPWSGILLYGPPGTGKSYLAKAIATECKSTFISITSADILSKWYGDSEKGVKALFGLARERRPCIVFIDEVDAICGQRTDTGNEASQRVLTQFLTEMQGVGTDNVGVLVLGATNIPWSLDTAIRRRFENRIYIPLPGLEERHSMFKVHMGAETEHTIKENEWMQLAQNSEHYSGADIGVVCREALLRPIRRLTVATHFKKVPNPDKSPSESTHLWLACSPGDADAKEMSLDQIDPDEIYDPPVTMSDMLAALSTQRPTVSGADLAKYQKFTEDFGREGDEKREMMFAFRFGSSDKLVRLTQEQLDLMPYLSALVVHKDDCSSVQNKSGEYVLNYPIVYIWFIAIFCYVISSNLYLLFGELSENENVLDTLQLSDYLGIDLSPSPFLKYTTLMGSNPTDGEDKTTRVEYHKANLSEARQSATEFVVALIEMNKICVMHPQQILFSLSSE